MALQIMNTQKMINEFETDTSEAFTFESCHIDEEMANNIFDIVNIDDYITTTTLTEDEIKAYNFNPKALADYLYKSTYLGVFILHINKLEHPGEFDLNKLKTIKIINSDNMKTLLLSVNRRLNLLK